MRRWLSILMLTLLPLQFSWAAVAAYCGHETGQHAEHLGHHEHQHTDQVKADQDIEEASALIARTDAIERSKRKAKEYAEKALAALEGLPDSEHKLGLQRLAAKVVDRNY